MAVDLTLEFFLGIDTKACPWKPATKSVLNTAAVANSKREKVVEKMSRCDADKQFFLLKRLSTRV